LQVEEVVAYTVDLEAQPAQVAVELAEILQVEQEQREQSTLEVAQVEVQVIVVRLQLADLV
jgi:hypothetical protein